MGEELKGRGEAGQEKKTRKPVPGITVYFSRYHTSILSVMKYSHPIA